MNRLVNVGSGGGDGQGITGSTNGLVDDGNDVKIGGLLTENTLIETNGFNFGFTGSSSNEVFALSQNTKLGLGTELTEARFHILDDSNDLVDIGLKIENINLSGDSKITFEAGVGFPWSIGVDTNSTKSLIINNSDSLDFNNAQLLVSATDVSAPGTISGGLKQIRQEVESAGSFPGFGTTIYDLSLASVGKVILTSGNTNFDMVLDSSDPAVNAIEVGGVIEIEHIGTGTCRIIASGGTNLWINSNDTLVLDGQYSRVAIQRMPPANTFRVFGQLTPV
jgi:hypothetical protein